MREVQIHDEGVVIVDDMKISFKVEVTACEMGPRGKCPFRYYDSLEFFCGKANEGRSYLVYEENKNGLTASCPMVKEQFERLE